MKGGDFLCVIVVVAALVGALTVGVVVVGEAVLCELATGCSQ